MSKIELSKTSARQFQEVDARELAANQMIDRSYKYLSKALEDKRQLWQSMYVEYGLDKDKNYLADTTERIIIEHQKAVVDPPQEETE